MTMNELIARIIIAYGEVPTATTRNGLLKQWSDIVNLRAL